MKVSEEGVKMRVTWRKEDLEDVEKAREFFLKLTKQGWFAARLEGESKRILEFRPEYEELWFIPLSEGG